MSRFMRPIAAVVFAVIVTQSVEGGAAISLVPNNPGPYFGGEILTVDVYVTSSETIGARYFSLDFSRTDPVLILLGPDGPDIDTIPEFVFDFSKVTFPQIYDSFPNLPQPITANFSTIPIPSNFFLQSAPGVPFHAGSVSVKLPTAPGEYVLDAMNFGAPDYNSGAIIGFYGGFPLYEWTTWSTLDDGDVELTGGQRTFVVVPEPATLAMLALGLLPLGRRRAAKRSEIA